MRNSTLFSLQKKKKKWAITDDFDFSRQFQKQSRIKLLLTLFRKESGMKKFTDGFLKKFAKKKIHEGFFLNRRDIC
jgi:hypothetical protein